MIGNVEEAYNNVTKTIESFTFDNPEFCWEIVDVAINGKDYIGLMVRHVETKEFYSFLIGFDILCRYLAGVTGIEIPKSGNNVIGLLSVRVIMAGRLHNDIINSVRAMQMGDAPTETRN